MAPTDIASSAGARGPRILTQLLRFLGELFLPALLGGPCRVEYAQGKPFGVCSFEFSRYQVRLLPRESDGAPLRALERAKQEHPNAVFLGNAGMYHASGKPVGVLIDEGVELSSLNQHEGHGNFFMKPNGVFWTSKSAFHVSESRSFAHQMEKAQAATQSGPLLLLNNIRHPSFRRDSRYKKIRNGVGVSPDGQQVFFAISMVPVSFWELAGLFRERLGASDALYLDGVVSSVLAPGLRHSGHAPLGPIFLIVAK